MLTTVVTTILLVLFFHRCPAGTTGGMNPNHIFSTERRRLPTTAALPGGYKVGDPVYSLVMKETIDGTIWIGDLGHVMGPAKKGKLEVSFAKDPECRLWPNEISKTKPELPGDFKVGEKVIGEKVYSLVNKPHDTEPLSHADSGTVQSYNRQGKGKWTVQFDYPAGSWGMRPHQISKTKPEPLQLPEGINIGDTVYTLVQKGNKLKVGDSVTVEEWKAEDTTWPWRVSFHGEIYKMRKTGQITKTKPEPLPEKRRSRARKIPTKESEMRDPTVLAEYESMYKDVEIQFKLKKKFLNALDDTGTRRNFRGPRKFIMSWNADPELKCFTAFEHILDLGNYQICLKIYTGKSKLEIRCFDYRTQKYELRWQWKQDGESVTEESQEKWGPYKKKLYKTKNLKSWTFKKTGWCPVTLANRKFEPMAFTNVFKSTDSWEVKTGRFRKPTKK